QRIGPTDATVLIMGESGTGKELVAESIHETSGRDPFVTVNCAAIPSELMESELFGAEKGAFTGATRNKPGLVEEAAGGTLFLDEIGELPISLQPKLLRFLETRRARRVGSTKEYESEVRVVSATNRDLRAESQRGTFRLDLFYRISEVILNTPPLRHRPEDIPDLSRLFLEGAAVRLGKNFESLEPDLIFRLQEYKWPGNVRELRQAIERLAIYYDGPVMRGTWWVEPEPPEAESRSASPFPEGGQPKSSSREPFPEVAHVSPSPGRALNKRQRFEYARQLLEESDGDLSWTAAQLGIHPTTLYRWRKEGKV
ncbi:MAG: sigma-54 interaction domain-containing protein, partial [Puniceicoccales bacterium]